MSVLPNDPATVSPRPPVSGWIWLRRASITLVVLLLVVLVLILYRRHRIQERLNDALAEMDREERGWRLHEIEAARKTIPDALNAALHVQAGYKALPSPWKGVQDEDAMRQLPANIQLNAEQGRLLAEELARQSAALTATRSLPELETGRYPIRYSRDGISTSLPHLTESRNLVNLLTLDAYHRAQTKDFAGALRACRAATNVGRAVGDEPLSISQVIRYACVFQGLQATERVLGQGEPPAAELAALQDMLAREDRFPAFEILVRGERAALHELLDALESGEIKLEKYYEGLRKELPWMERWFPFQEQDYIRALHPRLLGLFRRQLEIARMPLHERGKEQNGFQHEARLRRETIPLDLLPNLGRVEEADRRYHARLRSAIAMLAAERFRQKNGSWPTSANALKDLVPADLLVDPCDGKPLRLRRLADGLVVYSVGVDGVDNGGNLDRSSGTDQDEGFRLWDVQSRRLPAVPVPPPLP